MNSRSGPRVRQQNKKLRRNIAAFLTPILILVGVPSWFLFPPQNTPQASNAVMVIAGASDGRHELGAQLVNEGKSPNFVVSNPGGGKDRVGSQHCRGEDLPEAAIRVWCMRPNPVTTTGEAMTIAKLAKEQGWTTLTAVTNRPHARRVHTIFERCTNLDVTVVPVDQVDMTQIPYLVAWEIGGYLKYWVSNPC